MVLASREQELLGLMRLRWSVTAHQLLASHRCGTSAYKSSSTDWKRKAATDAQTLNEYTDLFGPGTAAAADASEEAVAAATDGTAAAQLDHSLQAANADDAMANGQLAQEAAASAAKPAAKKQKKRKGAVTEIAAPSEGQDSQGPRKKKKSGTKGKQAGENGVAEPISEAARDISNVTPAAEPVAESIDANFVAQPQIIKASKQARSNVKTQTKGKQGKKSIQDGQGVSVAADEALALLGFPASKSKARKQ